MVLPVAMRVELRPDMSWEIIPSCPLEERHLFDFTEACLEIFYLAKIVPLGNAA